MKEVVITGMGPICPLGTGSSEIIEAISQKKNGFHIHPILSKALGQDVTLGECQSFRVEDHLPRAIYSRTDRYVHLGLVAAKLAIEEAKISDVISENPRAGVILGTGLGGLDFHEEGIAKALQKGLKSIHPLSVPRITPNAVSAHIAMQWNITGPNLAISTACSSGLNAMGEAFRKIRDGYLDIAVTGGVEAPLTPFTYYAYKQMRVLDKSISPQKASSPFDQNRTGFVLSEGGTVFTMESLEHAQKRNAPILARVLGFANTCGTYSMATPKPDGSDLVQTMQLCLEDAKLTTSDLDAVHAHGTGTLHNDEVEAIALEAFLETKTSSTPIMANKALVGHSLGAAGAIQSAFSVFALNQDVWPTMPNLSNPIRDWNFSNCNETPDIKTILNNSFGFGSNNACLLLGKIL